MAAEALKNTEGATDALESTLTFLRTTEVSGREGKTDVEALQRNLQLIDFESTPPRFLSATSLETTRTLPGRHLELNLTAALPFESLSDANSVRKIELTITENNVKDIFELKATDEGIMLTRNKVDLNPGGKPIVRSHKLT